MGSQTQTPINFLKAPSSFFALDMVFMANRTFSVYGLITNNLETEWLLP